MSLVTTITLTIGVAIAKQMAVDWLGAGAHTQTLHDLMDLCRDRLDDALGSRPERRQLEQVAAQAVREMTPLWEQECRGLDDDSRCAVVLAVGESLAKGRIDAGLLIQNRLDAERLAKTLAEAQRQQTAGFSDDERTAYDRLLRETSRQIVYVANHMSGYEPLVDRHTLLSLDQVLHSLERLMAGPADAERDYEARYRQALPVQINRFDQIGIPYAEDVTRRQSLDRAYLGLSLEADERYDPGLADDAAGAAFATGSARLTRADRPAARGGSIHDILAIAPRLVIRGQPGSGKSTLLRWLAVRSSHRALAQDHAGLASLDGSVPFYLRLRAFKEGGFPNPRKWPELNAPSLALDAPPAWMDRLLQDGRALVLIDGVDEVSLQHRKQLLEELENLVRTYPLARYVITSRPAVIKHWSEWASWMRSAGFVTAALQDMEPEQVNAFVDQWHDALLASTGDADEQDRIRPLPAALKQLLRQRLPLRQLARNPLLCTMICALHRDRPQSMPRDRVTLYEDCVTLLLYRRDTERGVGSMADYPALTHRHEEAVLRDYAHHLLFNEESEESFEEMESFFNGLLARYQMPGWTGALLRDFYLKRTGLLIEPADGRIAFAHRSFQEFLAAQAIVNRNDIGMLLSKARDDQWRETILLTVALPEINEKQSDRFFRGLLKKADALNMLRNRHELYLLAVACTESPMFLSDELRQEILGRSKALLPPRSDDDVRLLARAGDPLLDLLHYDPRLSNGKLARCVNTLAEIGCERALPIIAAYAQSPSYRDYSGWELRRAVGAALWRFDLAEYCRCVLRGVEMVDLTDTEVNDAGLAHLATLTNLQSLHLSNTQVSDIGLAHLATLTNLQSLYLSNTQVSDAGLAHLATLTNLRSLHLSNTQVSDACVAHIDRLGNLETLDLGFRISDAGLVHLAALTNLRDLLLWNSQVSDAGLAHLTRLSSLRTLYLSHTQVGDAGLAHVAAIGSLQRLLLSYTHVSDAGLAYLSTLRNLRWLYLMNTEVSDAGLAYLAKLDSLEWLNLGGTQVSDAGLAHLAALGGLQLLILTDTQVSDAGLTHIAALTSLQDLYLKGTQVSDAGLTHIASLTSLKFLDLCDTQVSDAGLSHIANLTGLQRLNLRNTKVKDVSALDHLLKLDIVM